MLKNVREYTDGKYRYSIVPMEELGNVIMLENLLEKKELKKYFTKDDEAAIAIFESMIECQFNEGNDRLERYDIKERLADDLSHRVRVDKE